MNTEINKPKARFIKAGEWLYDGIVKMPVQIFAINYDYYYEMDKQEGFLEKNAVPELNENGEQYMVVWHSKDYFSFDAATDFGGFTLEEAIKSAETTVNQKINWQL